MISPSRLPTRRHRRLEAVTPVILAILLTLLGLGLPATSFAQMFEFEEVVLSDTIPGPRDVLAADIDADGDLDVVAAFFDVADKAGRIELFENLGGTPPQFASHPISSAAGDVVSIAAADLDSDGDLDVVSGTDTSLILWYETQKEQQDFGFTERFGSQAPLCVRTVVAADIDADGKIDLVSASRCDNRVWWHPNLGGDPPVLDSKIISGEEEFPESVHTADLDGDGDIDVISAGTGGFVTWFENDGAESFLRHELVTAALEEPEGVAAADVNGDGRIDILAGDENVVLWLENNGPDANQALTFTAHPVAEQFGAGFARTIEPVDVDNDGFLDVVLGVPGDGEIHYYRNDGGQPPMFARKVLAEAASDVEAIFAVDLDADFNVDVLAASASSDHLSWYESRNELNPFIRGDINLDGRVTLADAGRVIDFLLQQAEVPGCVDAVDIDDSGDICIVPPMVNQPCPSDYDALVSFLLALSDVSPPPLLPAPFPTPGFDETMTNDTLTCETPISVPPPAPISELSLSWEGPDSIFIGQKDVELFLRVQTDGAIDGCSLAYLLDSRIFTNIRVDFADTVLTEDLSENERAAFEASRFFEFHVQPSANPDFLLLSVATIFVEESGGGSPGLAGRLEFPATRGTLNDERLIRLLFDVSESAPEGDGIVGIAPFFEPYPDPLRDIGGLRTGFLRLGSELEPFDDEVFDDLFTVTIDPELLLFIRGDSDTDRDVDMADAVFTLEYLFLRGVDPVFPQAADANNDGAIDIGDPLMTLFHVFRGSAIEAPHPDCGDGDPTSPLESRATREVTFTCLTTSP